MLTSATAEIIQWRAFHTHAGMPFVEAFQQKRLQFHAIPAGGVGDTHHLAEYQQHEQVIFFALGAGNRGPVGCVVVFGAGLAGLFVQVFQFAQGGFHKAPGKDWPGVTWPALTCKVQSAAGASRTSALARFRAAAHSSVTRIAATRTTISRPNRNQSPFWLKPFSWMTR